MKKKQPPGMVQIGEDKKKMSVFQGNQFSNMSNSSDSLLEVKNEAGKKRKVKDKVLAAIIYLKDISKPPSEALDIGNNSEFKDLFMESHSDSMMGMVLMDEGQINLNNLQMDMTEFDNSITDFNSHANGSSYENTHSSNLELDKKEDLTIGSDCNFFIINISPDANCSSYRTFEQSFHLYLFIRC